MAEHDLVRVRVNGIEKNTGRIRAEQDGLEVIDSPTHDRTGRAVPPSGVNGRPLKAKTTVAKKAAAKQAVTEPADTKKELDK